MVLNLSVIDSWIRDFQKQNSNLIADKKINWQSRSDCFQSVYNFFIQCCKKENVKLKSLHLQALDRSVFWTADRAWPSLEFTFKKKIESRLLLSPKPLKTIRTEIGFRGQLKDRFQIPPTEILIRFCQGAVAGELANELKEWAQQNNLSSLCFEDDELQMPLRLTFS